MDRVWDNREAWQTVWTLKDPTDGRLDLKNLVKLAVHAVEIRVTEKYSWNKAQKYKIK